jgi:multidrug efflux pump subunit AcrA (membrane-fusion protein)
VTHRTRSSAAFHSHGPPRRAAIGLLAGLVALVAGCGGPSPDDGESSGAPAEPTRVVGLGRVEPELKIVDLTSEVWGTVDEIRVPAGGAARGGEPILTLRRDVEAAGLQQAVAAVHVRRAAIAAAEASLLRARAEATNARRRYDRISALHASDLEADQAIEDAATTLEALDQDVSRLEADLASARAFLEQAQADSMRARAELERRILRAPGDGQVLALDLSVGSVISPERAVGAFGPASPAIARCEIDELFAGLVEIGQDAFVRRQGSVDTLAAGVVSFVGPYLRAKSLLSDEVGDLEDRRVREVHVLLDDPSNVLLGTRIECVIDVARSGDG